MAIPIVGIIFFDHLRRSGHDRRRDHVFQLLEIASLHRTVRMMVEKGQEVPAALFARRR